MAASAAVVARPGALSNVWWVAQEAQAAYTAGVLFTRARCLIFLGVVNTQSAEAHFEKRELQVPGSVLSVLSGDFDKDQRTDLAVIYKRGAGPLAQRFVGVFFRETDGYTSKPNIAFKVPPGAALFDVGDALGDQADEFVYLGREGVFAQAFVERRPRQPVALVKVQGGLIGRPEPEELAPWDFLRTVSALKRTLLIVPTVQGIELYERDGERWGSRGTVNLQFVQAYDAESGGYRPARRGGSPGRVFSLRVISVVPSIDFNDQNGDGRADLVTHFEDQVAVYFQGEDGRFSPAPDRRQWLKSRTLEELESKDVNVHGQSLDLDRDGIGDMVLSKIGGGITTLKTEIQFYRGLREGGFEPKAVQTFRDDGFADLVSFVDLDGDGLLEMIHPHSEVSIVAISRMLLSQTVGLDLRIRRAKPDGFFATKTEMTLESSYGLDLSVGATLRGAPPFFGVDFNGDGRPDVLLPENGQKMHLYFGEGLNFNDAHITLTAPGTHHTQLLWPKPAANKNPDVLCFYPARPQLSGTLLVFHNRFAKSAP